MKKRFLRRYGFLFNKRIWITIALLLATSLIFIFISPQNILTILVFIILLSASVFAFFSVFMPKKVTIIISIFVFLLLLLKSLAVLDLMNFIILTSFIGAFSLFLHQK